MERMFRSLGEQLQAVRMAAEYPSKADRRLLELNRRGVGGAAGASEAVPADGGFIVQPDIANKLIERVYQDSKVLSRCFKLPVTKGNQTSFPSFDEQSRADGSRFGGIQGYWANEADTATASKPKFRRSTLTLHKMIILCYVTDELLSDTNALDVFVDAGFRKGAEFKMVDAIINGDGSGKPAGILYPSNQALIQVAKDSGQGSGTLNGDNVSAMVGRLWPGSDESAVWLISKTVEQSLVQLTISASNTNAAFIYRDGTILGRKRIVLEQCPQIGTPGDILLADLSRYCLSIPAAGEDGEFLTSLHVDFASDQAAFRFTLRVDGMPLDHTPITPFDGGTNTTSPFVCVEKR